MSGKVVHFEVPYDDGDRAREFYGAVFGWQLMELPAMSYTIVSTGPTDPEAGPTEPGYIGGGMFERSDEFPGRSPTLVIDVPSIDEALAQVVEAGGAVAQEKLAVGDMGFAAYFTDTEGNLMGLWETAAAG